MNHYADPAFHECMYIHYADLLNSRTITAAQREFYQEQQNLYAARYTASFQPNIQQIYFKILNLVTMQNNNVQQIPVHAILHMAKLIEKRNEQNQPCILHCNDHRICLTDSENVVIAWTKTSFKTA
jgi:hypothetical protein